MTIETKHQDAIAQQKMASQARLIKEMLDKKVAHFSLDTESSFMTAQAWFKQKYNRDWRDFIPAEELKLKKKGGMEL